LSGQNRQMCIIENMILRKWSGVKGGGLGRCGLLSGLSVVANVTG
jgi:hypothetical protein